MEEPPYEEKALDYSHFTALEGGNNYHTFDITNLVRKWYTGTNNGVMLMSESKAILFDMDCIMMEN